MKFTKKVMIKQHNAMEKVKNTLRSVLIKEEGMGMVEIALIIIIIIALGLTFKKEINDFLMSIFETFDIKAYQA